MVTQDPSTYVQFTWVTFLGLTMVTDTYMINPFLNLLFSLSYVLCAYFYFLTMLEDPGYVPKTNSRSEQNPIVQELINGFKFNEHTFCVTCMVRKPVRSKHCKRCGRCVVKQDQ